MYEPVQKCENNEASFKQSYTLKLFIAFKMAYSCCFSLGGNLDFLDFLQKSFITSTTGGTRQFFTLFMLLLKRPPKEVSWWLTNVVPLWRVPYEEVGNGQRIVEQKTDFMMDTKTSRACELDQVWPDLAKFCHWQNLQDFGNIWRAYLVLATFWTYFG